MNNDKYFKYTCSHNECDVQNGGEEDEDDDEDDDDDDDDDDVAGVRND